MAAFSLIASTCSCASLANVSRRWIAPMIGHGCAGSGADSDGPAAPG